MKILSLGAVLMDQLATVDRFPVEDDEVFVPELKLMPGGSAANFAVFCARLGATSGFIGKVGKDALGDVLVNDLKKEHVNVDALPRSDYPTGMVYIAVRRDGQRAMFAYSGAANDLDGLDIDLDYMLKFDHLHMADLENLDVLDFAARRFGGSKSLNAGALIAEKGQLARELISHVDMLICSEEEAKKLSDKGMLENAMSTLQQMGPKLVVVTRGQEPSLAFDGEKTYSANTFKCTVVDATGAGDAFSAGFVYKYLKTHNIEESLRFANATAAIVIQSPGARGGLESLIQVDRLSTSSLFA